jgi:hypothetical protein
VFTENAVEVYFPQNGSWVIGSSLPTNRRGFGVAVVKDLFYVMGGFSAAYVNFPHDLIYGPQTTYYATNEQYTPFGYGTVTASDSSASFPLTSFAFVFGVSIAVFCVGVAVFYLRKQKTKRSTTALKT